MLVDRRSGDEHSLVKAALGRGHMQQRGARRERGREKERGAKTSRMRSPLGRDIKK